MESRVVRRFLGFVLFFVAFLLTGLIALESSGGGTGNTLHDAYRIVAMFALNGDWAFEEGPVLRGMSFIAPLATVIGIVELLGRSVVAKLNRDWKLLRMRRHAVVFGLNKESLLLMEGISKGRRAPRLIVVGEAAGEDEQLALSRIGAVLLEDFGTDELFQQAMVDRADVLISFIPDTDEAITLLTRLDGYLSGRPKKRPPLDLWMRIDNPKLGDQLAEYFGYGHLQERLHPRFFSLEETSARRLWRSWPLDSAAEAQGQDQLHLAVYGFNRLASQIMVEAVRQSRPSPDAPMKITLLTDDVEEAREKLSAWRPGLKNCAEIDVRKLPFHRTGIANDDYHCLPEGATAHVVCHEDATASAATALSLRRLLLMKPNGTPAEEPRRLNAPIFVRFERPTGIGQLLSGDQGTDDDHISSWPDGVETFGGYDAMLSGDMRDPLEPTVIDTAREAIARHIHLSYQLGVNEAAKLHEGGQVTPAAERSWQTLAPEFRDSCRHAADHLWTKARTIGSRIIAEPGWRSDLNLGADATGRLTRMEHQRWTHERFLSGWSYAEKRVDAAKQHPLLRPYEELPEDARKIDETLVARMGGALRAAKLSVRKEHVVGITGHRLGTDRPFDKAHVRALLIEAFCRLKAEHPEDAVTLLTPLATGADSLAAEAARAAGVPYTAVFPLPFEASRRDYEEEEGGLNTFLNLVAGAERVIELPLLYGDLADVAPDATGVSEARDHQYALAGGYIARRCHTLLAVWDEEPARGFGGTATIVGWAKEGTVPADYALESPFTPPEKPAEIVLISPTA
ncbi:hypothetical protein HK107_10660 [Parvularcula sp. ZS-1/3]|uniref:Ryanodine receptor Ryr domain-containing protein n=1 Tax=Parvularcula mediterranea TaxID=2732508 RepID=A0A7Y3RML7_9PROT|nr:RyR domain-containing protein [Parvularcula mediterranea]NNU16780.1 hypothetical protein [Parvularcula mediterranea]